MPYHVRIHKTAAGTHAELISRWHIGERVVPATPGSIEGFQRAIVLRVGIKPEPGSKVEIRVRMSYRVGDNRVEVGEGWWEEGSWKRAA